VLGTRKQLWVRGGGRVERKRKPKRRRRCRRYDRQDCCGLKAHHWPWAKEKLYEGRGVGGRGKPCMIRRKGWRKEYRKKLVKKRGVGDDGQVQLEGVHERGGEKGDVGRVG